MIDQSSYIAAFLVIGFLMYITMRGELSQYRSVLGV